MQPKATDPFTDTDACKGSGGAARREKQPAEGIRQGAAPQLAPSLVQPSHQANHVLPDPLAPMQSHSDGSEALSNHSKDLGA